ncbi:hypothetical protein EXIGLDRAFT_790821, partial [Exidia glandulosa HHB12029]
RDSYIHFPSHCLYRIPFVSRVCLGPFSVASLSKTHPLRLPRLSSVSFRGRAHVTTAPRKQPVQTHVVSRGSNGRLIREPLPFLAPLPPSRSPSPNMSFTSEQATEIGDIVAASVADVKKDLADLVARLKGVTLPPPAPAAATTATPGTAATSTASGALNLFSTPDEIADAFAARTASAPTAVQHSPAFFPGASPSGAAAVVNPYAGKNAVIRFPHVDQTLLQSVLSHTVTFKELIKLNPVTQQSSPDQTLQWANGQISVVDKATAKAFPDMGALLGSLVVYFDILSFSLSATHGKQAGGWEHGWTLSHGSSLFIQHLLQLQQQSTFSSILKYAERFFLYRRAEMLHGQYSGWWAPDTTLQFFLVPLPPVASKPSSSSPGPSSGSGKTHKPKSETVCLKFLEGKCPGDTCAYGRQHTPAASKA